MIRRFVTSALALCIALAFCQAGFAAAGVPQLLNYQGKLTDSFGWPVGGSKYMTFEFYDAPFGGNLLEGFSETQQVVVTKGIFNVLIGSAADPGVPASVFDLPSVYLSVKVEGEQLSSRQRIASRLLSPVDCKRSHVRHRLPLRTTRVKHGFLDRRRAGPLSCSP